MSVVRPREIDAALSVFPARTPTLPPATHTNSYALGAREVLLVEPATPFDDELRAWVDWARSLASQGRRPVAIFATHYHEDHVGGLPALAKELGLPLWTHEATLGRLGARGADLPVAKRLVDGDELLLEGPVPAKWQVLETPGHAWGHLCLWEAASRTVVAGDMVASVGTILIAPGDGDMRVYLDQLERLARLDARLALPAHGDPIAEPSALFRRYIEHRLMRQEKVAAALALHATPMAPSDLVPTAYADTPAILWPIATLSLTAHLDKLVGDGRARRVDEGRYARVVGS